MLAAGGVAAWRVYDYRASEPVASTALRIVSFSVTPGQVRPGALVTLAWEVEGAEQVRMDPLPGEDVPTTSQLSLPAPDVSTDFLLTATIGGQTLTRAVRLDVIGEQPALLYFEAQPTVIDRGEGALLSWGVVGDDVEVTLFPGDGTPLAATGSIALFPPASTVYTLIATNAAGQAVGVATVTVGGTPVPERPTIARFAISAGPCEADRGVLDAAVHLEWEVVGAESVTIDGVAGGLAPAGCLSASAPMATQTYTLIAIGFGGASLDQATVTVSGAGPQPARAPPTAGVVMVPVRASSGGAAEPPEGVDSGHLLDARSMIAEDAVSAVSPSVERFAVSDANPRLGEEVVVTWAVGGADAVVVDIDPAPPGMPVLDTPSGIFRFVATQDVQVRLEATRAGGAVVRRQMAVAVLWPAGEAVALDIPSERPALLAADSATGATALATEAGDIWLFQADNWVHAGQLSTPPTALALVGGAVFVVDAEGWLHAIDLADPAAGVRAAIDPWRGDPPVVDLGGSCRRVAGVAGLRLAAAEGGAASGVLLVACANPPAVIALPVAGVTLGGPTWSRLLDGPPAAIALGGAHGMAVAVHYAAGGPMGRRVDLFDAATGNQRTLSLAGSVRLAVPSPDGRVLVVAFVGEPGLVVLDAAGAVSRRVGLEAEVSSLAWISLNGPDGSSHPAERPDTAPVGGAEAVPPPPLPSAGDPTAAAVMAPGTVLVTWVGQPGGALLNLAVWAEEPVAALIVPERPLAGLVDSGSALVVAVAEPGQGVAIPWQATAGAPP